MTGIIIGLIAFAIVCVHIRKAFYRSGKVSLKDALRKDLTDE